MAHEVAHSVRGRLRVRYPVAWLREQRAALESGLRAVPGVRAVSGSPVTGSVRIEYNPFELAETGIVAALTRLDQRLGAPPAPRRVSARRASVAPKRTPLLGLLGASTVLAATCLPAPPAVVAGLVMASEVPSLLRATTALRRRRLNGDVLEASTLLLLSARRQFVAAALLTWLRTLGEYVVARTVVTARRSLHEVIAPPDAVVTRIDDNERAEAVRVQQLRTGDVIVVGGGHRLPVDGTVVRGEALVNQQTMTGEALPVERRHGDRVFAATTVELGEIDVRVDQVGLDTAVGRIVRAIEDSAEQKSDIQAFAERLADRDVGRTLGLAALGAGVAQSFDAGTAILVSDYGLAARVGVPTAIVASISRAYRHDILIKGPRVLENLARIDTVVFDKTGTLTLGAPRVTRIVRYGGLAEDGVLRLVAAAERPFRHPIARAVARLAAERRLDLPEAETVAERVGLGVEVHVEGSRVLIGSRRLMESREITLRAAANDEAAAHAIGASLLFVAVDGRLAAVLVLQDELRADAPEAVRGLRARHMRNVILLSGDHAEPSRVIAESLGLRHHYADLLPEDKRRLIAALKDEGRVVAMVGDGVNDALALDEAHVGIAVPGGAEVATEAADVVLLGGGLDRVVLALDLARESIGGVRRTLGIAARANLVVVGLASFGFARPITSILLSHGTTVAGALWNSTQARWPVTPQSSSRSSV
ncbi:MAG TPA: heavy metal translocating P-type ATPase [Methylomirabilota bacterium]|nr:heavy metal translocating P-type ATPase [Methylomirabilota bacterium]